MRSGGRTWGLAGEHGVWRENMGSGGRTWDLVGDHGIWRENMGSGGRTWDLVGEFRIWPERSVSWLAFAPSTAMPNSRPPAAKPRSRQNRYIPAASAGMAGNQPDGRAISQMRCRHYTTTPTGPIPAPFRSHHARLMQHPMLNPLHSGPDPNSYPCIIRLTPC